MLEVSRGMLTSIGSLMMLADRSWITVSMGGVVIVGVCGRFLCSSTGESLGLSTQIVTMGCGSTVNKHTLSVGGGLGLTGFGSEKSLLRETTTSRWETSRLTFAFKRMAIFQI